MSAKTFKTKEERIAYGKKILQEHKVLQNRCHMLSGGMLCQYCNMECEHKPMNGKEEADDE